MALSYIQRKSAVSSILWILGCGQGMTYYPVKKVYAGFNLGNTIWLLRKSEGFLCGDKNTFLDRFINDFQKYIIKHPQHADSVKKIYLQRKVKFSNFINTHLAQYDYSLASNKVLWLDYQKTFKGYQEVYPYSEPLAIAIGNLSDRIKGEFLKKGLSHNQCEKLILPTELSFIQKEQLEFFKIAIDNKGKGISNTTLKKIQKHHDDYTWLPYDYGVTAYSLDYFINQLKVILEKDNSEIIKKYQALKNYSQNLKKEQRVIIKKFKINFQQESLINIIKIAFYLVDSKKELFTRCHWFAERLFLEISQRLNLPLHLTRYLLPDEVADSLINHKKINFKKLQSRYDNCVLTIKNNGAVNILEGRKAEIIINNFVEDRNRLIAENDLKGRVANPGTAKGLARVIMDARECDTFKHGEILITAMTSPDYILAARRAAAIITDEGGITCHAAIISRELGIPCIIGTRNATKVLHDGDLIEVNANQGTVEIVSKA